MGDKLIHDSFPPQGDVIPSHLGGSDFSSDSMYNMKNTMSGGFDGPDIPRRKNASEPLKLSEPTKRKYSNYEGW